MHSRYLGYAEPRFGRGHEQGSVDAEIVNLNRQIEEVSQVIDSLNRIFMGYIDRSYTIYEQMINPPKEATSAGEMKSLKAEIKALDADVLGLLHPYNLNEVKIRVDLLREAIRHAEFPIEVHGAIIAALPTKGEDVNFGVFVEKLITMDYSQFMQKPGDSLSAIFGSVKKLTDSILGYLHERKVAQLRSARDDLVFQLEQARAAEEERARASQHRSLSEMSELEEDVEPSISPGASGKQGRRLLSPVPEGSEMSREASIGEPSRHLLPSRKTPPSPTHTGVEPVSGGAEESPTGGGQLSREQPLYRTPGDIGKKNRLIKYLNG